MRTTFLFPFLQKRKKQKEKGSSNLFGFKLNDVDELYEEPVIFRETSRHSCDLLNFFFSRCSFTLNN